MNSLKGFQRKYLKGLAHGIKPVVYIGQKGMTDSLLKSVDSALKDHELIKMKFNDFKEKDDKNNIITKIEQKTGAEKVGMIGHTAIMFRQNEDSEKQKIMLPQR